jgi:galactokinase
MAIEFYAVMAADRPASAARTSFPSTHAAIQEPRRLTFLRRSSRASPSGAITRAASSPVFSRAANSRRLDVRLHSTVPLGGGLSSSAALEVCTATLLEAVTGKGH